MDPRLTKENVSFEILGCICCRFVRHFGYPKFKHIFQVGLYTIRSVSQEVIRSMIISGFSLPETDIFFETRPSNNTPRIHPENE